MLVHPGGNQGSGDNEDVVVEEHEDLDDVEVLSDLLPQECEIQQEPDLSPVTENEDAVDTNLCRYSLRCSATIYMYISLQLAGKTVLSTAQSNASSTS